MRETEGQRLTGVDSSQQGLQLRWRGALPDPARPQRGRHVPGATRAAAAPGRGGFFPRPTPGPTCASAWAGAGWGGAARNQVRQQKRKAQPTSVLAAPPRCGQPQLGTAGSDGVRRCTSAACAWPPGSAPARPVSSAGRSCGSSRPCRCSRNPRRPTLSNRSSNAAASGSSGPGAGEPPSPSPPPPAPVAPVPLSTNARWGAPRWAWRRAGARRGGRRRGSQRSHASRVVRRAAGR
jgi:hypothetical protein